ncbi:MAG TPA: heat-inducible transcriptional repressor HrcA, partial [Clostridia bacterium]
SAGRVPSDKGYRFYVDQLMNACDLKKEEIENISRSMEVKINELSQLIRQASQVMSKVTRYTSMATMPQMGKSSFKAVQVVPVESGRALIIVVTNAGIVRNCLVEIPEWVQPDFLIRISNIFNDKLKGLTLEQVNANVIAEIEHDICASRDVLDPILGGMAECIDRIDSHDVYLDGTTNIFNYPEFRDIVKAKEFLSILDEKQVILKALSKTFNDDCVGIKIGSENDIDGMRECSLITATYRVGDSIIGSIGIIGPTRMEYGRVISSINFVKKKIDQELLKLIGENNKKD